MKQLLARICFRIAVFFRSVGKQLNRKDAAWMAILDRWKRENGNKTLRMEYNLNPDSVVFDLGGYEGQWASDLFARYACQIEVFEPYPLFAQAIAKRFQRNSKINVHTFGLDRKFEKQLLGVDADATSLFKTSDNANVVEVELKCAKDFIQAGNFERIDLMKINIEGGEYSLLEHLIEEDLIKNIQNIQVQFHHFMPNAKERMAAIQANLKKTHRLTYQFEFLWENWERIT